MSIENKFTKEEVDLWHNLVDNHKLIFRSSDPAIKAMSEKGFEPVLNLYDKISVLVDFYGTELNFPKKDS